MAADEKWYFTKDQLQNTPSRKCGFDADKELSYRQQAANFIQDMGQKLQVSQLCINTAIVYMHRFYMFHSFTHFPWNTIAAASFFLAAKVEEQPRKLEHVIRVANICLHREQGAAFDAKSEQYAQQSQDLVFNENVLLQTLGFDVAIDHPHTHVVRCCHLVRASKDLAQTSYFMASNSLHLTTMCLQYKPTVVACFCIHLACKWSNWQIPKSNEGKDWFYYVDKSVTSELLEQLTAEFLVIFDKCPSRLKRKILSISNHPNSGLEQSHPPQNTNSPFDTEPRKTHSMDKDGLSMHRSASHDLKQGAPPSIDDPHKKPPRPHEPSSSQQYREYREKKEREKQQHHSKPGVPQVNKHLPPGAPPGKPPHNHHRPPIDPNRIDPKHHQKMHHRPSGSREQLGEHVLAPRENALAGGREYNRETNGRESREGLLPHRDREHRELHTVHPAKDVQKHLRPELINKVDSDLTNKIDSIDKQRYDPNRQKLVDPKLLAKHDPNRQKYAKRPETVPNISDNKKPVPNPSAPDKNSYMLSKQTNSTSQRHKSPFTDVPKSVPLLQNPPTYPQKSETRNGNHAGSVPPPPPQSEKMQLAQAAVQPPPQQAWPESLEDPSLVSPPPPKRQPSLFSPEKTTPPKKTWNAKTPPSTGKRTSETPLSTVPTALSPFASPPPKQAAGALKRHRTSSSGSEPELRPVVKKLDQISGFENIIRDSKMGIKLPKVPDIIQPICDPSGDPAENSISKELKPPEIIKPFSNLNSDMHMPQPLVNGIETDPTLISSLLKEVPPSVNHLPVIETPVTPKSPEYAHLSVPQPVVPPIVTSVAPVPTSAAVVPTTAAVTASVPSGAPAVVAQQQPPATLETDKHKSEHHHKSEKKKKKDKHKHKEKDRSKEDKEKKKKHKDKDKEKHKNKSEKTEEVPAEAPPLKITIAMDKIQPPPETSGLKVKISKDRLKTDKIETPPAPPSLKIKISKDAIQYNSVTDGSRKRDRDRSPVAAPPAKAAKTSYNRNQDNRQNGRNSYSKVSYNNNNNSRGRYGTSMGGRMPPPQVFPQNPPPQFFVPNYPPPSVPMAGAYMYTPDALYHPQFYPGYPMYAAPDMYVQQPDSFHAQTGAPPPLPEGPPPNTPPPPPPE